MELLICISIIVIIIYAFLHNDFWIKAQTQESMTDREDNDTVVETSEMYDYFMQEMMNAECEPFIKNRLKN